MKKAIVIGGGISGIYSAIQLKSKIPSLQVDILEAQSQPLKKLLATGNGRCNLSNQEMTLDYFQSDQQVYVQHIIEDFDVQNELLKLGIMSKYQGNLLYPQSEQALTIKNNFLNHLNRLDIHLHLETKVTKITHDKTYHIFTTQGEYTADFVIYAVGSEAGGLSVEGEERYRILEDMNLSVVPRQPSLVQMYTSHPIKELKGVRVKGRFDLYEDGLLIQSEVGEMLFTDYGVSGIAIMQLSAFITDSHNYSLHIDFLNDYDEKYLNEIIALWKNKDYNQLYNGILNVKLAKYLESFHKKTPEDMIELMKNFQLDITGLRESKHAQVMRGGLSLNEVTEYLEVKKYPGMFVIGEILNVVGMCGGYNIHFALGSAHHIVSQIEREFYDSNS